MRKALMVFVLMLLPLSAAAQTTVCCNCAGQQLCVTSSGGFACGNVCAALAGAGCVAPQPTATRTPTRTATRTRTATAPSTATFTPAPPPGAFAVDTFERGTLGGNWVQFAETAANQQGSVYIGDGHTAQGQAGADAVAYYQPFAPSPASAYACIKSAGSVDGQEACACLGADNGARDVLCCCLKHNGGTTQFELFGWDNNAWYEYAGPTNLSHQPGDFMAIRHMGGGQYRCARAPSTAPTTWTDLTGNVSVPTMTNPGRGGVYFYGGNLKAEQFEVGNGSQPPTTRVCGSN